MTDVQEMIRFPLDDLTTKALRYASDAHGLVGQRRRYTNEPYIVHPVAVANMVWEFGQLHPDIGFNSQHLAAALLHDVLEDTVTREHTKESRMSDILLLCGLEVFDMVAGLTNPFNLSHGNRQKRMELERGRLHDESSDVQNLKCFDMVHNTESIVEHDKNFARRFLQEKRDVIMVLTKADLRCVAMMVDSLQKSWSLVYGEE